jgi:NTE family protein
MPLIQRLAAGCLLVVLVNAIPAGAPLAEESAVPERPRIGLVLGGGGARGGAHIGVLKVLEELRIPVDCVAGTSMGALVGATFASGATPAQIERKMLDINWPETFGEGQRALVPMQRKLDGIKFGQTSWLAARRGRLHGDGGLLSTQNMEAFFRVLVGSAREVEDFDNLAIPFRAVATDLAAGEMVVLADGELTVAMRASMAVPGAFAPVMVNSQVLADGGMTRNLPVDVARDLCADVVIAVSLQGPPPRIEDLSSFFALAGRSIDAMIAVNEREQLALLTEADVSILVPVGDITSSQFTRVPETIPLGEQAARQVAGALQRYALPEQEYRQWRAGLERPDTAPVKIEAIRFMPQNYAAPAYLATRLTTSPGDVVELAALEDDMNRIFASGDFSRVDYRLLPGEGDGKIVEIRAVERPGRDFVRFDLGMAGSSGGDTLFTLRADHRREWVNSLGGQWRNALQLGQMSALTTAFHQPLDVQHRYFLEPGIELRRSLEDVFDDGDRLARYDLNEALARVDVGRNIANNARVHAGIRWGYAEFDVDIGSPLLIDTGSSRDASAVLGGIYDTRDADILPTSGTYAQFGITSSGSWLGGEQSYETVEAVVGHTLQWGRSVLMLGGGAGRTIAGDLPRYRDFKLGGARSFPAFARGELRGEGYWSASATWLLPIADLQALFGQVFYSGIGLQAAQVTDRLDGVRDGTILGASFTLGARTPVGPLLVILGAANNGSVQLHFALGRPIAEGSLLDRLH